MRRDPVAATMKDDQRAVGVRRSRSEKIITRLVDGKERTIQDMTATLFWGVDGRPISAAELVGRLFGDWPALFRDEDELAPSGAGPIPARRCWRVWTEKGFGGEQLREIERMIGAEKSDL